MVEAKGKKRRQIEDSLKLRAAMRMADAVVGIQEERLTGFDSNSRRLSGMAIRAVDQNGLLELRSRWFAVRIATLTSWMVGLLFSIFLLRLYSSLHTMVELAHPVTSGQAVSKEFSEAVFSGFPRNEFVTAITILLLWPLTIALLLRLLRWPQLVPPAILTFYALGFGVVAQLLGLTAGSLSSRELLALGEVAALTVACCFDPTNLYVLFFSLFLAGRSSRCYNEYRELVPCHARRNPRRILIGRLALVGSMLFALLSAGFCGWSGYSIIPAASANLAAEHMARGRYDQAIIEAGEAIRLNPRLAVAYELRAAAYLHKRELKRALADVDEAISLDPSLAIAYTRRAAICLLEREFERVIRDCDRAIRLNPKQAIAYNLRANAYLNKGEFDRVIADSGQAIRLDPQLASAYLIRSIAFTLKRDLVRAHADSERAAELDPSFNRFIVPSPTPKRE